MEREGGKEEEEAVQFHFWIGLSITKELGVQEHDGLRMHTYISLGANNMVRDAGGFLLSDFILFFFLGGQATPELR